MGSVVSALDWSYDEQQLSAPSRWAFIHEEGGDDTLPFAQCGGSSGRQQAPVAVSDAVVDPSLVQLGFSWLEGSNYTLENNGKDITLTFYDVVSSIALKTGEEYLFKRASFHVTSGHTFGGGSRDLEIVFEHEADAASSKYQRLFLYVTCVVSSGPNEALEALLPLLPSAPMVRGATNVNRGTEAFSISSLLPEGRDFVRYEGSDIRPPCSSDGGCLHFLFISPSTIGELQLQKFIAALGLRVAAGDWLDSSIGTRNSRPASDLLPSSRQPLFKRSFRELLVPALKDTAVMEEVATEAVLTLVAAGVTGLAFILVWLAFFVSCCSEREKEEAVM